MRTLLLAVALTALTGTGAAQPPEAKPKTDAERIQGSWLIVGLETGGKAEPERNYRGNSFTFSRDKATLREGGFEPIVFTVALDPSATPRAIDLTARGGVLRGIYKLDGDDLIVCVSIGGGRPTEFATKAGGEVTELFTLKRNNWERFTDKAGGFALDLPAKPATRATDIETPAGASSTTIHVARTDQGRVTYAATVTPLPGKLDAKETDAVLLTTRETVVAELAGKAKATLDSERTFRVAGTSVREATFRLEHPNSDDKGVIRTRAFALGGRAFVLAISGSDDTLRSPQAAHFWNSFLLVEQK